MSKQLFKSTLVTGSMTMLSRILGFVRDIIVAKTFGTSVATDAFFVAFKIPNFLRRLFAEGAFSQAFVPVLSEYKTTKSKQETKDLIDNVAGTLATILLVVTLLAIIIAPIIIMIFAPGYLNASDNRFEYATDMLRITFPYLFLISLTALGGAILNTHRRFAVPAFLPVLLNVSLILSAVYLSPLMSVPIYALAIGVTLGGLAQLMFMLPFLRKIKSLPSLKLKRGHKGVRKIYRLIIPMLFGASISQLNILLDTVIASFLEARSISWLYYADRLLEFPIGVFGVALATVVLPSLSKDHAKKDLASFKAKTDWSLRLVLIFTMPAALGLLLLAQPLLITLFQYGEFSLVDTQMSAYALQAYSIGLIAFIAIKILANGYFSRQDTKTPVKIGIIAMLTNMVFNLVFVGFMIYYDFVAPHAGLALATTCSAIINASLLYRGLAKAKIYQFDKSWLWFVVKIIIAAVAMTLVVSNLNSEPDLWINLIVSDRIIKLTLLIVVAMIVYFASLLILKVKIPKPIK